MNATDLHALAMELGICLGNDLGQDETKTATYFKGITNSHGYAEAYWFLRLVVDAMIDEFCRRFEHAHELWDAWDMRIEKAHFGLFTYDASAIVLTLLEQESHDVVSQLDPYATATRIAKAAVARLFDDPVRSDELSDQITSILTP